MQMQHVLFSKLIDIGLDPFNYVTVLLYVVVLFVLYLLTIFYMYKQC